jgi:hypothetical protein
MKTAGLSLLLGASLVLAACNEQAKPPESKPAAAGAAKAAASDLPKLEGDQPGTPMAERVAVIGLLNKRNGQTRDFELKPGESVRLGKVALFVRACERTAPWETYPDQGAFVRVAVRERPPGTNNSERWRWVFSGWLFKENPAANVLQHPVYDVWVKACKMNFPGEEPAPGEADAPVDEDKKPSSAPQSAPRAAPVPAPVVPTAADEGDAADGEAADGEATVET